MVEVSNNKQDCLSGTESSGAEPFQIVVAGDEEEVMDRLSGLASLSDDWIFRGQRLACWDLKSTLERVSSEQGIDAQAAEDFYNYEFKRRAHHYLPTSHIPTNELEWLALMQHYGAPTRLLDFTHSPWVAAYFALERATANSPSAVWAIDMAWCVKKSSEFLEDPTRSRPHTWWEKRIFNPRHLEDCFGEILREDKVGVVVPAEPYRMNERLYIQQGVFLCPGSLARSFQENLFSQFDPRQSRKYVKKIVMQGEHVKSFVLGYLYKMNVNRATLFPGLEGFAQSLEHNYSRMLAQLQVERHIEQMALKSRKANQEQRD